MGTIPAEEATAQRNAKWNACWRCGSLDHSKAGCDATDEEAKERRKRKKMTEAASAWQLAAETGPGAGAALPAGGGTASAAEPVAEFNPSNLLSYQNPFSTWCDFLLSAIATRNGGAEPPGGAGGCSNTQKQRIDVRLKGRDGSGHTYGAKPAKVLAKGAPIPDEHPGREPEPGAMKDKGPQASGKGSWNESRRTTWLIF